MAKLHKCLRMVEVVFKNTAQAVFYLADGFKDSVAHLFSEFFKEALHRIQFRATPGQLFKGNVPPLTDLWLMGACTIGHQHHFVTAMQRAFVSFRKCSTNNEKEALVMSGKRRAISRPVAGAIAAYR